MTRNDSTYKTRAAGVSARANKRQHQEDDAAPSSPTKRAREEESSETEERSDSQNEDRPTPTGPFPIITITIISLNLEHMADTKPSSEGDPSEPVLSSVEAFMLTDVPTISPSYCTEAITDGRAATEHPR